MNKSKKRGLQITVILHVALIIFLFVFGVKAPDPVFPDPDGVQINFGDSEDGAGETESNSEEAQSEPEEPTPPVEESVPEEVAESDAAEPVEENVTQDYEDAPSLEEIKRQQERKKKLEEQKKEQERLLAIQQQKERKEREEEERKRQEQAKIDQIKNRAKNAFGRNTSPSSGEGDGKGNTNQGAKNGSEDSQHRKGIGHGNGISFELSGRSSVNLSIPKSDIQSEGDVVVEIIVNRNGEVVEARPGVMGTTATDTRLWEIAKKAALKTKFNSSNSAPDRQKGKLKYSFKLH